MRFLTNKVFMSCSLPYSDHSFIFVVVWSIKERSYNLLRWFGPMTMLALDTHNIERAVLREGIIEKIRAKSKLNISVANSVKVKS